VTNSAHLAPLLLLLPFFWTWLTTWFEPPFFFFNLCFFVFFSFPATSKLLYYCDPFFFLMSENGSWGADCANCKILSFLFFSMGDWKVHPIWFFAFGQVVMMMSKVTNRTDDIIGWVSLMWSLFFRGTFDVEFVLSGAQFWMWSFFFSGGVGSLMWSLVFGA